MKIEINNQTHLKRFIELNELWITNNFAIEESDRILANNPTKPIDDGGFIFSLEVDDLVVGVCALLKDTSKRFQLARMAVDDRYQGYGYGRTLINHALSHAKNVGATSVYLLSNTGLTAAIALYKSSGFVTVFEGPHPVYNRCNIVMECTL